MELKGELQKEMEFTIKLLLEWEKEGRASRFVKKIKGEEHGSSISQYRDFLIGSKTNGSATGYTNKLRDEGILEKVGEKKENGDNTELYELNKDKLWDEWSQLEEVQELRPVFRKLLNKEGDSFPLPF